MGELADLRKRVTEATGPDWKINEEITAIDGAKWMVTPLYTASVDAALALVERMLPGSHLLLRAGDNYASCEIVKGWGAQRRKLGDCQERADDHLALAVLAALLGALEAREERDAR